MIRYHLYWLVHIISILILLWNKNNLLRSQAKMLYVSDEQSIYIFKAKFMTTASNIPKRLNNCNAQSLRGAGQAFSNWKRKLSHVFLCPKLPKFRERPKHLTKTLSILQTVCKTIESPVSWMCFRRQEYWSKLLQLLSLSIKTKAYKAKPTPLGFGLKMKSKINFFWNGTVLQVALFHQTEHRSRV